MPRMQRAWPGSRACRRCNEGHHVHPPVSVVIMALSACCNAARRCGDPAKELSAVFPIILPTSLRPQTWTYPMR
jgi:hypothetical protein